MKTKKILYPNISTAAEKKSFVFHQKMMFSNGMVFILCEALRLLGSDTIASVYEMMNLVL